MKKIFESGKFSFVSVLHLKRVMCFLCLMCTWAESRLKISKTLVKMICQAYVSTLEMSLLIPWVPSNKIFIWFVHRYAFKNILFYVYESFVCVSTTLVPGAYRGQKRKLQIFLARYWDSNLGSLEEQSMLLTNETSLQPPQPCLMDTYAQILKVRL